MPSPICANGHAPCHTKRHPMIPTVNVNGTAVKYYLCPACQTGWYGREIRPFRRPQRPSDFRPAKHRPAGPTKFRSRWPRLW